MYNITFNDINNELNSYILGWFYSRASGHIQVRLSDIQILRYIKQGLEYDGPIYVFPTIAELNISQKPFLAKLATFGCVPNRYHSSHFPSHLNLLAPFIRGIFDSYGRVVICKSKYLNIHITYNETFINGLRDYLQTHLQIETKHYYRYTHTNTLQMMITTTVDAIKFLNWIYKDANYYMARKYLKYQEYAEKGV